MNYLRRYPLIFGHRVEACDLHLPHVKLFVLMNVHLRDFITRNSCFLPSPGVS